MSRNPTRRTFLAGSASAVLAVTTAETAQAQAVSHDAVAGSFRELLADDTAVIELADGGAAVRVRLGPGAEVLSGRTGTLHGDLTRFAPGEAVVIRFDGPVDPGTENVVSMVQSLVDGLVTTVREADDTSVETSAGRFAVAPSHRGRWKGFRGPARITYWEDPASGARYVNAVHPVER